MEYVMPNWCSNILVVMGKKDEVEKFKLRCGEEKMLENHFPTPNELLINESPARDKDLSEELFTKYGAKDWYDWRVNNWGTKWEVSDLFLKEDNNIDGNLIALVYTFDTAWAPPEIGIQNISGMYKDVIFHLEFEEPGMAFEGYCRCLNGETIGSNTHEMYDKWANVVDNLRNDWEYTVEYYKKDDK
jgi:hypothetical protein